MRQDEYNQLFGYMLISRPREVVVSVACYSFSRSVRLRGFFKSVEDDYFKREITPWTLKMVLIKIQAQPSTIFFFANFFIVLIDMNESPLSSFSRVKIIFFAN